MRCGVLHLFVFVKVVRMTEKRFTKDFECPNNFISFIYDNGDVLTTGEVVGLLNELNDENEQLKQTNQRLTIALKEIKEKTNIYLEMTKKGEDQP